MTLAKIHNSPIGTTEVVSGVNEHWDGKRADMKFIAWHLEKIPGGVRPIVYFGETEAEARGKAEERDRKRKLLFQSQKERAKARRTVSL